MRRRITLGVTAGRGVFKFGSAVIATYIDSAGQFRTEHVLEEEFRTNNVVGEDMRIRLILAGKLDSQTGTGEGKLVYASQKSDEGCAAQFEISL